MKKERNNSEIRFRSVTKISSLALAIGFAMGTSTAVSAADTDGTSKPLIPQLPALTWNGITLYGVIDVSLQYESHGAPVGSLIYSPLGIIAPQNRGDKLLLASNQASQSFVGIKTVQGLGAGFAFVGKLEMGFNPTSGRLSDGLGSLVQQNGKVTALQSAAADGPRAGQVLNGEAYGGFSSDEIGTLTGGRHNILSFDAIATYDPLASYGFSLIGYSGAAAGQGSSEDLRVDSSVKYSVIHGHVHASAIYADPHSNLKSIWQLRFGFDFMGASLDAIGGKGKDQISPGSLGGVANIGSPFLGARVYDTSMYGVFGKYNLAAAGLSKATLSGGWERIDFSNPSDGGLFPGHETIGGYQLGPGLSGNGLASGGIVNYGFTGGDRILNVYFGALKYQYSKKWDTAFGYYRFHQNSFGLGVSRVAPGAAAFYSSSDCSSDGRFNCSGIEQVFSTRTDFQYNRNIGLYAGIVYSMVKDGLAFGYIHHSQFAPTVGLRLAF